MLPNWYSLSPAQQQAILDGPTLTPPDGVVSNFDHPSNENKMVVIVVGIALALATIAAFIRLYAKVVCLKHVRLEDYLGLLAFGTYIAHAWSILAITKKPGMFVHQWDVRFIDYIYWSKILNLLRTFYFLTLGLAKVAILHEWARIFVPRPGRNSFFWLCYAVIAANIALYLAAIPITFLICIPQQASWNPFIPGRCINRWAADVSAFTFHLVTDIFTFLLPQRVIWTLNMPMSRRAGVSAIFSFGVLTCLCAAARVYTLARTDYSGDAVYKVSTVIMWGVGETTALLFVFCIPAAPKAFRGELGLTTVLGRPLRSWTGATSASRAKTPGTEDSLKMAKHPKRPYNRIKDGDSLQLETTDTTFNTTMDLDRNQTAGITRTTELIVEEGSGTNVDRQWVRRQHPWMGSRGSS